MPSFFLQKRQRHETKLLSPSWDRIIVRKWTSIPLDIYVFRSEHRSSCYKPPLYTLPTTTDTVAYIAILKRDEKYPTNFYHIFKTTTTLLSTVKVYLRFKSVLSHEIWKARSEGEFGLFQPISWWNTPRKSDGCEKKEKKRERMRPWGWFFFRWKANLWENFLFLLCRLKTKYKQATEDYMK